MPQFKFYGASDDLFMVDVDGVAREEIYPPQQYQLVGPNGSVVVHAEYGVRTGVWCIGLEPLDEDVPVPLWPVSMSLCDRGYSMALTIEAPDGTKFQAVNIEDDE